MIRHVLRTPLSLAEARLRAQADAAAYFVGWEVRCAWLDLLALLHRRALDLYHQASSILGTLSDRLSAELARRLAVGVWDAHAGVRAAVTAHLPRRLLVPALREDEGSGTDLLAELLLPTPDAELLRRIIYATGWQTRLQALTKLAAPEALAAVVAQRVTAGQTPAHIARAIRPVVQGIQSSARRIARTEALRVGHEVQMHGWEQLGDMIVGYQVHAVHGNPNSRPWHLARDGAIYYKRPGPGQKGLAQMPRPPLEAADPAERPAGTPHVAHNCLCYLTPVLSTEYAG